MKNDQTKIKCKYSVLEQNQSEKSNDEIQRKPFADVNVLKVVILCNDENLEHLQNAFKICPQ